VRINESKSGTTNQYTFPIMLNALNGDVDPVSGLFTNYIAHSAVVRYV
jgi:hypothetical protein